MDRYDPLHAPEPADWLDLDEDERIQLAQDFHRRERIELPNARVHAVFHVIVENQTALGDATPVEQTLKRLQEEGLDRHDAVHAVGSVLAEHMYDLMQDDEPPSDPNEPYYAALQSLTAEGWRRDR